MCENPKQKLRDTGILSREDFDGGPISLDEIEPGLYLGNLTAATHMETLRSFNISYILTLDSIPLPQHITEASFLTTKYIHIADMPKEDILHHLNTCYEFINEALTTSHNILVHCYFGVSRSSSAVIAYIMKHHNMDYASAYDFVKSKRRFVQPNAGFAAQLKLWHRMGCNIDPHYQKYKIYRLRLAGDQVRKAKILPPNFNDLIKPDPAITQENPEPIVYRCRKCRRVLASKSNILQHIPKNISLEKTTDGNNGNPMVMTPEQTTATGGPRLLEQIAQQIRKVSLASPTAGGEGPQQNITYCQNILFVEPIAWMKNIGSNTQGRLNCPKCDQKLGNYSWVNGCQCPCGEEVTPAFYMIPSKVELSKAVQNVQTTL
ncbi:dual specificity protein phosphatase MPK-4 [Musca domestica]|uniref:protein-tyrosine-phosphatase n=1 Tax=Musca domestica TaxID=7370 RepID=A0A9J7CN50_MUSDO|nr:dual specificity protein phosphatase MPK-4 [Musca domestica]XP_011290892.2 dual specificity protein phosphatase MPK-4 [Musca domestica]XP_011290893.2 dual specificity protein phosphatase MPK-4 [Musca domestica]XP_019890945.2 dual specificity protein phosphatase MPK-4 [Musca domestica]